MPPIPTKIGRYDIIELVGRGGMGVLYRARDANLERDVALKMMLVDFSVDSAARGRFEREARAVARLQHRNIVTIHELGEADGTPYIVMEFLSGKDLDGLMNPDGLTLVQKLDIAVQLCEGLGYAHEQGIVHRDVKPGNVRVLEDGTVKILDFGIAKFAVSSVTQTGSIMGTPSYMSPEQIMGQPVDGRADLFSAGVLLYELLGGKKPFVGEAPTAVVYQIMHVEPPPLTDMVPDLPEALLAVVSRALAKNPNERYSRASEMAADLQMVKMMLDLPLNTNSSSGDTGKLFATTIREKTATGAQTPMLNARMRTSAVAATADAAPRARFGDGGSNKTIIGAVAAVVVLLVGGAAYMMSGSKSEPPPAAASAGSGGAPAGGGAASPGGGTGGAAAPAAAGAGVIAVSSTPTGAHILVNGVDSGKVTNAAIPAKANDTIQLTLTGFEPSSAKLTPTDIDSGSINFRFSRTQGPVRLSASAPYPFELVQGGRIVSPSAASHEVTIQPGSGNVVARNRELLLSVPITVDFTKSRQDATLPALGLLNVFSNDGTCTVTADGQDLGPVPIVRKSVAPGSHTVAVKCAGGNPETKRATVSAGSPVTVTF